MLTGTAGIGAQQAEFVSASFPYFQNNRNMQTCQAFQIFTTKPYKKIYETTTAWTDNCKK